MTRVTCSRQPGVFAWREQIADANINSIFLYIKQYMSELCPVTYTEILHTSYYYKNLPIDKKFKNSVMRIIIY